ncbi:J domain-containing protein [Anthocerotibacter panamensis]|uniref:J domain-containing protein n=1 Tax=Anthocerotibacter panamensis TaxID=2857077 RepID=UPI001C40373F|nr:J domain-containing protein [Anthocerotibacter panamensis]
MRSSDLYTLLGLSPKATAQQIEERIRERLSAARRMVLQPGQQEQAGLLIQQLREARLILLDPLQRARYDTARLRAMTQLAPPPTRPAPKPSQSPVWVKQGRAQSERLRRVLQQIGPFGLFLAGFLLGWIIGINTP